MKDSNKNSSKYQKSYSNDDYLTKITDNVKKRIKKNKNSTKENVLDYALDDEGNIKFFLDIYKKFILFNKEKNVFYYWTGRLWREDKEEKIKCWIEKAMEVRRNYSTEILEKNPKMKNHSKIKNHISKCCNLRNIKAIYEGVKIHVSCNSSRFNRNKNVINLLDGTVNLITGESRKHKKEDYITMLIPIALSTSYDDLFGKCENCNECITYSRNAIFEKFLLETFQDAEYIEYIQRLCGYFITGETKEQSIFFAYGTGANGKSTLLSLIRYILADYSSVISSKVITSSEQSSSILSELSKLSDKRFVSCSELNDTAVLNEGRIKTLSSGETITAKEAYGNQFIFEPEFKCIIDTNHLPQINGTDYGLWRRIKILPFYHTMPKHKFDKDLLIKLKKQKSDVLAWLIVGATKYYSSGLGECKIVETATKKYRLEQDTVGSFTFHCLIHCDNSVIRARDLYNAYLRFCDNNLLTPVSETKFGKDFSTHGYKRAKDKISRKYIGIKLKQDLI